MPLESELRTNLSFAELGMAPDAETISGNKPTDAKA